MSAEVTLGWNNAKLAAGARQASSIVDSTTAKMRGAFAGLAATGGAFLGVREIVEATVKYDSLRLGMVSLTGSVEAATERMSELRTLAKDPGLGFEQVVETDIRLRSAGISASVSERAIREFGNALAVVGKGKEELDGVALALSQIASKGKVSAEEINQIAERVPQIRTVMKDVFGTADTEEIQKMGVPVESFITLVVDGFSRTIPRAVVGLQGKWDNFTDALTSRLADVGTGISDVLVGPLEDATARLEQSDEAAQELGKTLGAVFGGGLEFIKTAKGGLDAFGQSLSDLVAPGAVDRYNAQLLAAKTAQDAIAASSKKVEVNTAELKTKLDQAEKSAREYEDAWEAIASDQAAAAEEMEKTSDSLAKLKIQLDAANESKLDLQLDNDLERLGLAEAKLKSINNQINATKGQEGGEVITAQLDVERVKLEAEILRIKQAINREDDERLTKIADEVAAKEQAMQLFALELAIAEAASRGQDAKVAKLERERDIIEQTTRLMNELGVSYAEAARLAERLVNAEQKTQDRKSGEGERSKILGYSRDRQGDAASAQLRATEARDFKSRQANTRFEVGTGLEGGRFDAFGEGQRARFGQAFGNPPAAEQAIKQPDSGLSQIMAALDKWAANTTETFERAFQ